MYQRLQSSSTKMRYHFRSSEADFSAKKPIQRKKYHFTECIILSNGPHLTSWKLLYNFSRILALILPSHLSIATMYFRQRGSGSYLAFTHANLERVSVRQWFRQWILRRGPLDWSHIDRHGSRWMVPSWNSSIWRVAEESVILSYFITGFEESAKNQWRISEESVRISEESVNKTFWKQFIYTK